MRKPDTVV